MLPGLDRALPLYGCTELVSCDIKRVWFFDWRRGHRSLQGQLPISVPGLVDPVYGVNDRPVHLGQDDVGQAAGDLAIRSLLSAASARPFIRMT